MQAIEIGPNELDLTHTLTPGQSFRWKRDARGRWTGVVRGKVLRLWRDSGLVRYEILPDGEDFVRNYFRLDVDLPAMYADLVRRDPRIAEAIQRFAGLRVLRQEPEETLLSYICSAANSVPRISAAVELMSREYGEYIATVDGEDYYSFPKAEVLAETEPECIAGICSLGFRCANLASVARQILDRPAGWLESLRNASYAEARAELLHIRGVGMKIADCVLLFALDKDQAFPVDTHIRKIATRCYLPEFAQKTLTSAVYQRIVDYFQDLYGPYAGWAQEYLFYDDLLRHRPSERVL
ncbi:MAG: DNA glycosylase [Armatimonadota bacterium]